MSPAAAASPTTGDRNVALSAKVTVSAGDKSAQQAIDNNENTIWSAGGNAPQDIMLTLNRPYLVDSLQLLVSQAPAGQTTQEIWLGTPDGKLTLYKKLTNTYTWDGETLTIPIQPAQVIERVLVRTDASPSFVAWREVRVMGRPPTANQATVSPNTSSPNPVVNWPKLAVVGYFDHPTDVTGAHDGSGRLFVANRNGEVYIIKDGVPLAQPFLNISSKVECCKGEQGFFDVVFPPGYAKKHYFYASYTARPQKNGKSGSVGDTIIARFHVTSNPNVADPNSEQIILDLPQKTDAHLGGHMAFGPKDGYLYIGTGDGGLQNDATNQAQNPDSLYGKILRIDTESGVTPYAIPPTNPFVNKPGTRPEIWALGLRNPWHFSFDSKTGDLYIGDVGENKYEEIDYQPASSKGGVNYGWHIMEGMHCHLEPNCDVRGLTFPVFEYPHTEGCAIIGGTVYRGKAYPGMQGIYFYADYCTGKIWGLQHVGDQWVSNLLAKEAFRITDIGQDGQGNLYVTDYTDGMILKLTEPPATPG